MVDITANIFCVCYWQVSLYVYFNETDIQICLAGLSSSRSPSMRRMRQLLELDSIRTGAPSPVPTTPSGTLPRGQRQLDINPAGT